MTKASNWKQHYYTHTTEKPHKCTFCPKSFIRADHLRQHIAKTHHPAPTQFSDFVKKEEDI